MGNCVGNCVFRCGYTLYAETCFGRCLHQKYIKAFRKQFGKYAVHSKLTPFVFNDLLILPIPLLTSNYSYMVADMNANNFVLVDVGDASLIKNVAHAPDAILTTHKHWDHSGGNKLMKATFPNIKIYGGRRDRVPNSTHAVDDGETLVFGRLKFTAMWTPGHTRGHTAWLLHGENFQVVDSIFTGDHVMLAGCGAVFEGTIKQMIKSLDMISALPGETLMWPGHEMGLDNLELAAFIEPDNVPAVLKLVWAASRRDMMLCTCPSTIGEEKLYNPFLRTKEEALWKALGIYEKIKESDPPLSQDDIGALCFDAVISKSVYMRKVKREMKLKRKEDEREREKDKPNAEDSVDTPSRHVLQGLVPDHVHVRQQTYEDATSEGRSVATNSSPGIITVRSRATKSQRGVTVSPPQITA